MSPPLAERLTGWRQTAVALFYLLRCGQIDFRRLPNLPANLLACLGDRQPPRLPPVLQIDVNNVCNLRCPGCLTGLGFHGNRPRQMPWSGFTALADAVRHDTILAVLYNSGEPFLHPRVFDMIRYLSDRRIATMVSTNGHFLSDSDTAARLTAAGLSTLIISLSGASQETYKQYHRGGDLATVRESVRQVIRARNNAGRRTPVIILRFLVMEHNRHELVAMKRLRRELGADACEFRTVNWRPRLLEDPADLPHAPCPPDTTKSGSRICLWPWLSATVNWEGDVFPCCFYHLNLPVLGNAFEEGGIRKVWYNDAYRTFRKTMRQGKGQLPVCSQCPAETGFQTGFSRQQRTIYVKHRHASD